jgi:hypothetical protein
MLRTNTVKDSRARQFALGDERVYFHTSQLSLPMNKRVQGLYSMDLRVVHSNSQVR